MWFRNLIDRIKGFFTRRTPEAAPAAPATPAEDAPVVGNEKIGFFRSLGRGLLKVGSVIAGAVGWLVGGGLKVVFTVAGWVFGAVAAVAVIALLVIVGLVVAIGAAVAYLIMGLMWIANYIWDGSRFLLVERQTPGTTVETNSQRWAKYRAGEQARRHHETEEVWEERLETGAVIGRHIVGEEDPWVEVTDNVHPIDSAKANNTKPITVDTNGTVTVPGEVVSDAKEVSVEAKTAEYPDEFFTSKGFPHDPKKYDFSVHGGDPRVFALYKELAEENHKMWVDTAPKRDSQFKRDFSFWSARAYVREQVLGLKKPLVSQQLKTNWSNSLAKKSNKYRKTDYIINQGKNGIDIEVKTLEAGMTKADVELMSEAAKAAEVSPKKATDEVSAARAKKNSQKAGV